MATMREEFEAWVSERGWIMTAWDIWQAAAKAGRAAHDTPWKSAVIDQLVIAHILGADHEADPRKAVADLLDYHSEIAIDPRVSEAAAKLVATEREAWPDLTCVINWLEAGCDPKDAAKELRLYQAAIRARGGE